MVMSDAEQGSLRYAARERDFIATAGLDTQVEAIALKSGKWRAYLRDFVTPWSPRGQEAESKQVVRNLYGFIFTGDTREELIAMLKAEYPGWKWRIR